MRQEGTNAITEKRPRLCASRSGFPSARRVTSSERGKKKRKVQGTADAEKWKYSTGPHPGSGDVGERGPPHSPIERSHASIGVHAPFSALPCAFRAVRHKGRRVPR
ncbi:hypothetical protein MRX96_036980 [Rhipicephalus microplus]